jgi:hypothetical protein
MKWFRYPQDVIRSAVIPAVVGIGAPVIPAVAIAMLLLIMGLLIPGFDMTRLGAGLTSFITIGWAFLIAANVPRACAYLQQFSLYDTGIVRREFGRESLIRWEDVTTVEKRLRTKFENFRWIDETLLVARGKGKSFTIFDQLDGFDEFKASLSTICRQYSVPQCSIDRSLTTLSRLRDENPNLYRQSRRTGVRRAIERL